jgi:UDPglucose 6-dehydrogenase
MEIIIAGYGFVGKAVANVIEKSHKVSIVDPNYTTGEIKHFPLADGIIICVGTPSTVLGDCDVSQVRAVLDETPVHIPVLIKSTVRPDYLNKIEEDYPNHSICYSPEFLRAVSANKDFENQTYMLIGGEDPECFWQDLFKEVLPNCKLFFNCSIIEASTVKYAVNTFLSTKVAFFNQLYDVCERNGADYDTVRQLMVQDNRIGNSHTMVPGTDGVRGFGGACFPKDTNAYMLYLDQLGLSHSLVESAIKYNKKVRKNT